jgi:nucleotide sugar dehydrogenase
VVIRSTVPIGTTRAAAAALGRPLRWSACPDRSTAGRALADQATIPHIVGGLDEPSAEAAERLFAVIGPTRRVATPEAAEALKLFANVHRDMRFALANQFALICESAGVDFSEVRAAGAQGFPRFDLARAGPVGGPCLSKDVYLLDPAERAGLLRGGRAVNHGLVHHVAGLVRADLQAAGGAVAILGLAFKGDPPVREQTGSFGLALAAVLRGAGVAVRTWDPASAPASGRGSAIEGARVVILANDHPALADVSDLARPGCVVRDLCGVADRATAAGVDLRVFGEGATRR